MAQIEVRQATELCVVLGNAPGALAKLTEALAANHVNLEGLASLSDGPAETMRLCLVTSQVAEAKAALQSINQAYTEKNILELHAPHQPGVLAKLSSVLGQAGINIDNIYFSQPGGDASAVVYVDTGEQLAQASQLLQTLEV